MEADQAGVLRLVKLLEQDFYVSDDAAREAVQLQRMFNAIHFETGFKVDLVVRKQRPFSIEELRRRESSSLAGRSVAFATAEDTILTKLEWARMADSERQYEDVVGVIQVQGDRLDWSYLDRWAASLGVGDLLERSRSGMRFRS